MVMDISNNDKSIQTRVFKALNEAKERLKAAEAKQSELIAIIGLGCRFGKDISTPQEFWSFLKAGGNTLTDIPSARWNNSDFYDLDRGKPGKVYISKGGFLDDVSMFDPQFFGIAPREALYMDPQQRLLLEVAYEALEDAAIAAPAARIGKTGVFIGITNNDYARVIAPGVDYSSVGAYHISGNHINAAAGRISYLLNLNGPSLAVDTACSSSLVAVHLACRSLRSQECRQALVGGVNLILTPEIPIALCKNQMLAADGRCKTFDESADGFGIGEGCGVVILKRLSTALEDGDRIWAVIRGTSINNDGASGGFTVPNGTVQTDLIREALNDARLNTNAIDYVEAHGTGTSLGDPIEIKAIANALCDNRSPSQPLLVGSIKTNLGHLAAAAGISGLIKTVLSIYHSEIPAHLNLQRLNPHISWDSLPLNVVTQNRSWNINDGKMKAAGVSSFGASGTNAHVILSEAPSVKSLTRTEFPVLVTLSAKNEERLHLLADRLVDYVRENPDVSLSDIALSLNTGRFHHKQRLGLLVSNSASFQEQLQAFVAGNEGEAEIIQGEFQANPKIAFLFDGEEVISPRIAKELFASEPAFHDALLRCDRLLQNYLDFSIADLLNEYQEIDLEIDRNINNPLYIQPALFAIQYAICELWKSWGISPSAVLGFGSGEYLAAQQAGIFSVEDAVKLVVSSTSLLKQKIGNEELLAFQKVAEEVTYKNPLITLISGFNGEVASSSIQAATYWVQHLRDSDNVAQGIGSLHQMGYKIFLEIGQQSTNIGSNPLSANQALWLCSLAKDGSAHRQMQTVLGELYVRGVNINWQEFHRSHPGQKISLPNSAFIRKRYWVNPVNRQQSHHDTSGHPLVGVRLPSPLSSIQYRASISQYQPQFLAEHQVFEKPIFPGAAFIEMALAAKAGEAVKIENIEFKQALLLREQADILQLIIEGNIPGQNKFHIYHQTENNWDILVAGEIEKLEVTNIDTNVHNIEEIAANCPEHVEIDAFYQTYQKSGVNYGSKFQLINKLQRGKNCAFAQIELTDSLRTEAKNYHFHPAMLDACFQAMAAILFGQSSFTTYVPVRIGKFQFFQSPGVRVISVARIDGNYADNGIIVGDVDIYSDQGKLLVSIVGFELKSLQAREIIPHEIQPQSYIEEWIASSPLLPYGTDALITPDAIETQVKAEQLEQELAEKLRQYQRLLEEMESLSVNYIWEGLKQLTWQPQLGQIYQEAEIAERGGVVNFYRPLLSRCIRILAEEEIVIEQQDGWLFVKEPPFAPSSLRIQHLKNEFPDYLAEINLIERCGSALAAVMSGQVEPLELLFPQGDLNAIASVYSDAAGAKLMNRLVADTVRCAIANLPPLRQLRILEIGAGTGSATTAILPHLPPEQIEYVFTDISSSFLTRAKENFSDYPFIKYQILDIEKNPFAQGFRPGSFDIIIAANVLHATPDIDKILDNVRSLGTPNGLIVLLEST